jgi:ketosteroid isomerase-like protein
MIRRTSLLFVAIAAGCHTADRSGTPAQASAREALEAWSGAFLTGDTDRMVARYDGSPALVVIHSDGRICRGIEETRSAYATAFDQIAFEKVAFEALADGESGDLAWATGRFRARTRRKSDDTEWRIEVSMSFVMRRSGRSWKIVLEQSTPIAGVDPVRPADPGAGR